jgi:hypothetical protein
LLFKSIDESLAAALGLSVRNAVYLRFLTEYSLTRDDTPRHLAAFQTMLEDSFGRRAAKVLTKAIAKRLFSELQLPFIENPVFGLPEYVQEAKSKLLQTKSQATENTNAPITTCRKTSGSEEKDCS